MKFQIFNRKLHYWAAVVMAAPVLVILVSGILLHVKKQIPWIQPPEQRGVGQAPAISFDQVLEACRGVSQAGVSSWADIQRIDVRPSRGMLKVWAKSNWEIQIDAQTGSVLQAAYRRSDMLEAIHDGSWFHERAKPWLFLPSGVVLLVLWLTGMYLFLLPILARRRKRRREERSAALALASVPKDSR